MYLYGFEVLRNFNYEVGMGDDFHVGYSPIDELNRQVQGLKEARSNRLDLPIPSGIVGPSKRLTSLICPFRLALWKKENFSLLVLDGAHLDPNGVIPDELYVCPGRPKGLKSGKDT
uniref:Uncharacterized protein n=1 Tax=Vitis vinifera TaxID=29760 RepID=A5AXH7_VITVI|nr:hypothetical protein VITISV_028675 [Vitis vinifera]